MTNPYFQNYDTTTEQNLYEDLIIEAIDIHGVDCWYLPMRRDKFDTVYQQDDTAYFNKAYPLVAFIENFNGFQGEKDMASRFNLEIRDQLTFQVANLSFQINVGKEEGFSRPREGDLIYFGLNKKCFQIRFVENKHYFYQLGNLPTFQLFCELFEYSMERFSTGIAEIDAIEKRLSLNILDYTLTDQHGNFIIDSNGDYIVTDKYDVDVLDPLQDNNEIQKRSDEIIDFTAINPFCLPEGQKL